jgi:uncharacterized protein YkwD
VVVTSPAGIPHGERASAAGKNRFEAEVAFPVAGKYVLEVVAESAKGPEVVALFNVRVGGPGASVPGKELNERVTPEREDLHKAESQVLSAINRVRNSSMTHPAALQVNAGDPDKGQENSVRGVEFVTMAASRSALLDSVAMEHASEMVRLSFFAHVSPTRGDVADRVQSAGFSFARVTENLGEAQSALEAHEQIEASPGHLANVIDADVDLLGLASARVKRGTIDNVMIVEVFARALEGRIQSVEDLAAALDSERARRSLPVLVRDASLDALAAAHARAVLSRGPAASAAPGPNIAERALKLPGVKAAAADVMVGGTIADVLASKHLSQRRYGRVGLGVVEAPFGEGGRRATGLVLLYVQAGD